MTRGGRVRTYSPGARYGIICPRGADEEEVLIMLANCDSAADLHAGDWVTFDMEWKQGAWQAKNCVVHVTANDRDAFLRRKHGDLGGPPPAP